MEIVLSKTLKAINLCTSLTVENICKGLCMYNYILTSTHREWKRVLFYMEYYTCTQVN